MLHAVMLGSGPGRGRREWYPGFYLQRRRLGCRMNRGEQETLFRQSRQITRIVPSREDLVLSVLKSPINQQQQQQRQQCRHPYQSHTQGHFNCQGHPNNRKCSHLGIRDWSVVLVIFNVIHVFIICVYYRTTLSNLAKKRDVDNYYSGSRCICCTSWNIYTAVCRSFCQCGLANRLWLTEILSLFLSLSLSLSLFLCKFQLVLWRK